MKTTLVAATIVCSLISGAVGQKKSTILGDMVIGDIVAVSEPAREIVIKYMDKGAAETFVGTITEGYKVNSSLHVREDC